MSNLEIGKKIRAKRRELDMTQEELANLLGISKAAVSKWENEESYPDITMLPQIAKLFHITMDELFNYTLDNKPLKIVTEYHFGISLDDVDREILDHGTVKKCEMQKIGHYVGNAIETSWEVRIEFISTEEDFPYTLQKYMKPGRLTDGYSIRLADGKIIDDNSPNKHYVCREKVWEYHNTDRNYVRNMIKEQVEMGLIEEDDAF